MEHISKFVKQQLDRGFRLTRPKCLVQKARKKLTDDFESKSQAFLSDAVHAKLAKYKTPSYRFYEKRQLQQYERADWRHATNELKRFAYYFYIACRNNNLPVYAHTVYRSPELQRQLWGTGNSQVKEGPHNRSMAVDFVHLDYHWRADDVFWDALGNIGKQVARIHNIPIEWGGDWPSFYDPAHWQIADWQHKYIFSPDIENAEPVHLPLGKLKC